MKKYILIFSLFSFLLLSVLVYLFSERPSSADQVKLLYVSDTSKNILDSAVKKSDNIVGIQIVTINFQRNIRAETYISIDNSALESLYRGYVNSKIVETPLFNEDMENNRRMLRLINGEFVCQDFLNTLPGKIVPSAAAYVKTVCAIGIPPRDSGGFMGILTIYLKSNPTIEEYNSLQFFARSTSTIIYDENSTKY